MLTAADANVQAQSLKNGIAGTQPFMPLRKSQTILANGQNPFTLLWLGDSVAGTTFQGVGQFLQAEMGIRGWALKALTSTLSGSATEVYDAAKWIQYYFSLTSGGAVKFSAVGGYGLAAQPITSNKVSVYIMTESGGGTAKIQWSKDGTTWTDATIANGASADMNSISFSGTLGATVCSFTMTLDNYYIRVVNLTGTTSVLGAKIEDTTMKGVLVAGISAGGKTLAEMTACPSSTFTPVFTDIAPSLCAYEAKEEVAGSTLATQLDAWAAKWLAVAPAAEWVYTLSTPVENVSNNDQQIANNVTVQAWASSKGYFVWDAYGLFGSWENINATGWMFDGVHLGNSEASKFLARNFLAASKLSPMADIKSRFGRFGVGFLAVRYPFLGGDDNGLMIQGPGSTERFLHFYDESNKTTSLGVSTWTNAKSAYRGQMFIRSFFGRRIYFSDGNLCFDALGRGIQIAEGTNARMGVATMVAGTVTVANTTVTANTRIFITVQSLGTVTAPKSVCVTARTASTSFTITSEDATDTSVVAWHLIEPAP
jgi:hypothetical protein